MNPIGPVLISGLLLLSPCVNAADTHPASCDQDSADCSATAQPLKPGKYEVTAQTLNVRSVAEVDAELVGQLAHHAQVDVLAFDQQWALIKFNGIYSWVNSHYLNPVTESDN